MSDAQFNQFMQWLGGYWSAGAETMNSTLAEFNMAHWSLLGLGLVVWGLVMMRGMGIKKFG